MRYVWLMVLLAWSLSVSAADFSYSGQTVTVKGIPTGIAGGYDNYAQEGGGFQQDGTVYEFRADGTMTVNWASGQRFTADWGLVRTKDNQAFMRIKKSPGKPEFVGAYILATKVHENGHITKWYYLPDSGEIWDSSGRYQVLRKR